MRAPHAFVLVLVVACAPRSGVYVAPPVAHSSQTAAIFAYTPHPENDSAVEREYAAIDSALIDTYDFATGHREITLVDSTSERPSPLPWSSTMSDAEGYAQKLDALIELQPSPEWVAVLLHRRASVYETAWMRLMTLRAPLAFFSTKQRGALQAMSSSGRPALVEQAADIIKKVDAGLSKKRDEVIQQAAKAAVGSYAWAIAFCTEEHVDQGDAREHLSKLRVALGVEAFAAGLDAAPTPRGVGKPGAHVSLDRL